MSPTDLDKMVDKLLVFRKKFLIMDRTSLSWWQVQCIDQLEMNIDDLIKTIDAVGDAF